jgi:class 3 adenylate cyclase
VSTGHRFADNAIDLSVIRDLTEQDLKDLGVLLGHRRKILRAIAELDGAAPAPAETATEPAPRDEAERRQLTVMFCDLVGFKHHRAAIAIERKVWESLP